MQTLYVRVSDTAHAYLAALSAASGLSMAKITDLVISEARVRGWQITTNGARITDTTGSPAVAPSSAPPAGSGPGRAPDPPQGTSRPGPTQSGERM